MIYTHIFWVILTTVSFIIFAEYHKLRKISWILFIGCITYIFLIIEPETAQPTNNEYNELTNIDSAMLIDIINQTTDFNIAGKDFIVEPKNTNILISDEPGVVDKIQILDILTLTIATDIVEKVPTGISNLFLNDISTLYCFTAVNNTKNDNKIVHTWRHNQQDYAKSFIGVGDSPFWRCWSKITIRPDMIGDWQVIITDTVGNYLDSIDFAIIPTRE